MNYNDSIKYLNSFLNLEKITFEPDNRLWNLDRMRLLLNWAESPDKNFFSILIAGTKGKGSTGFFLESILTSADIKTGFYSSPHIEDPRERIRLDGRMVSKEIWVSGISKIRSILRFKKLPKGLGDFTYFEIMTLLAMLIFRAEGIRVGIFEVGMGGRLDATNVLNPRLVMLTPIHLDHEAFLGSTISKIAKEKAAIIKPGCHAIVSPQKSEAMRVILSEIRQKKAVLWKPAGLPGHMRPGLDGDYQRVNAGMALRAARILREKFEMTVPEKAIREGLKKSNWPGRMEKFPGPPQVLLDAAHNPMAVEILTRQLKKKYPAKDRILIFGTARDKKSEPMLKSLSRYFDRIIITRAANPRSREVGELLFQARGLFREVYPFPNPPEAFEFAKKQVSKSGLVAVTGSFFLLGEIRPFARKQNHA